MDHRRRDRQARAATVARCRTTTARGYGSRAAGRPRRAPARRPRGQRSDRRRAVVEPRPLGAACCCSRTGAATPECCARSSGSTSSSASTNRRGSTPRGSSAAIHRVGAALRELAEHRTRRARPRPRRPVGAVRARRRGPRLARLAQIDASARARSCRARSTTRSARRTRRARSSIAKLDIERSAGRRRSTPSACCRCTATIRGTSSSTSRSPRPSSSTPRRSFASWCAAPARPRARARIDSWLHRVDPYSDLAFLLELERALADLTPETQEPVRATVFVLYRKNKDLARRRALVAATVRRARRARQRVCCSTSSPTAG